MLWSRQFFEFFGQKLQKKQEFSKDIITNDKFVSRSSFCFERASIFQRHSIALGVSKFLRKMMWKIDKEKSGLFDVISKDESVQQWAFVRRCEPKLREVKCLTLSGYQHLSPQNGSGVPMLCSPFSIPWYRVKTRLMHVENQSAHCSVSGPKEKKNKDIRLTLGVSSEMPSFSNVSSAFFKLSVEKIFRKESIQFGSPVVGVFFFHFPDFTLDAQTSHIGEQKS